MTMVHAYLDAECRCPSSKTHRAYPQFVQLIQDARFERGKFIDLIDIGQSAQQLFLGQFRHLVLCGSDPYAQDIGRTSLSLRLLNRVKHAFSYAVKVPLRIQFLNRQFVDLTGILTTCSF